MKKFINAPENMLAESLRGFADTHSGLIVLDEPNRFVRRRDLTTGKVALVSGGGAGHEPLHSGFVGHGMLDAACSGQVFTSPTPDQISAAARCVDTGAGCLFLVKNYAGDIMNFAMAADMAGCASATVIIDDDVATNASGEAVGRRGVAGTLIVERIVGAAAEAGWTLPQLQALGERIGSRVRSMGVALRPCAVPGAGRPTFLLDDDEIEMGVGIHGEVGIRRTRIVTADELVDELLTEIIPDLAPLVGSPLLLLVNGFGGTPAMELYLMANAARSNLAARNLSVARSLVGSYVTSLEMAGCSLTLAALDDDLLGLWDAPVNTPALRWG
jgi:phosphoenolpyruvate---glycerone phosphotransferase subunit DhaK